jgi:hypothetical protein
MSLAKSSIRSVGRSPIPSTTLLIIIGVCVVWCSCKDQKTIWTAEALSPDGYRVATASTIQHGGPGNGGLYTDVNLKRTNDSRPPDEILGFDENNATMAQAAILNLTMTWTTPSHLNVTYNGRVTTLYFQVTKVDGVDISVTDLSKETNNTDARPNESNFLANECFAKGGLGIVNTNLYIDLKSAKNELQLSAGNKWAGQSTPTQEVVIFFENKILSPQALPDGFDLSKSVVISFESDKVRFFDFGKMSGGYYKRLPQN